MGGPCEPGGWREDGRPERVEVKAPGHPIARGVAPFTIPKTAMFAEPFRVPEPEAVVLVSTFDRGETFRSGLTWTVGKGRVAYFRPGHDGFPVLFHPSVRQVIANAAALGGAVGPEDSGEDPTLASRMAWPRPWPARDSPASRHGHETRHATRESRSIINAWT